MELLTQPGDVVLDLFAGTGNMARASAESDRHCVCVEEDKDIFSLLLKDLETS